MKKRLASILLLLFALVAVDWLIETSRFLEKPSRIREIAVFFVFTLLFFMLAVNATYRVLFDFNSGIARVIFFLTLSLVASMYLANRVLAMTTLWNYAVKIQKRSDHFLFRDDPRLGYRGVPNARGNYEYYIGDSINGKVPVILDSNGFRTSSMPSKASMDSMDLYLGCSFTFGDYIKGEETFAYKTSGKLGHLPVNAGFSGYGLAQMWLLADSLIPRNSYRYVFIQLTDWLSDRAVKPNRTTIYGYKAVPYISLGPNGPQINMPVYKSVFHRKAREWHLLERSYGLKLLFTVTDGFKIEMVDYTRYLIAKAGMKLGFLQSPAKDRRAVEMSFYEHVVGLALKNGATPVLVRMSYLQEGAEPIIERFRDSALIADTDKAANDSCRRKGMTYEQLYQLHHPHKSGGIHFDKHPNPAMTDLISDVILETLQGRRRQ